MLEMYFYNLQQLPDI